MACCVARVLLALGVAIAIWTQIHIHGSSLYLIKLFLADWLYVGHVILSQTPGNPLQHTLLSDHVHYILEPGVVILSYAMEVDMTCSAKSTQSHTNHSVLVLTAHHSDSASVDGRARPNQIVFIGFLAPPLHCKAELCGYRHNDIHSYYAMQ